MKPRNIAVIGAGLMGHGIAKVFATSGCYVRIYDPSPQALAAVPDRVRSILGSLGEDCSVADAIVPCSQLPEALERADFVVEAAIESRQVKQDLFATLDKLAEPGAILASNTSVIPITSIMQGLQNRSRCLGTHWWNPPYLVPLVEVIGTPWTAPAVIEATLELHRAIGKTPIHVQKDVPGFIGNRLQHALWREAISLVENGICEAADVDTVVKASFGRRLGVLGPLENADLVGTDLTLAIHQTVLRDLDASAHPSPYLEQLVADGRLGMKSGRGFLEWTPEAVSKLQQRVTRHLRAAHANDARNAEI